MTCPKKRRGADWEAERPSYRTLEAVWWKLRRGELSAVDGSLLGALPLEKTPDGAKSEGEPWVTPAPVSGLIAFGKSPMRF